MPDKGNEATALSRDERAVLTRIAQRDGVTEDEAATNLVKTALARRVRKKTGKGPAKVYPIKRKA